VNELKGRTNVLSEETNTSEEIEKELNFYRNQTKVLREKNRDLRNALLLAESKEGEETEEQIIAKESISDIRKIIADSKKQISEKLTQFKETIKENDEAQEISSTPQTESKLDSTTTDSSLNAEILSKQVEYLNKEIDRLETFLEQSEMVNNSLRELLTRHSIDVSEISKAINQVSKTAISAKAVQVTAPEVKEPPKQQPVAPVVQEAPKVQPKPEPKLKQLDPELTKMFNAFRAKVEQNSDIEAIKMEILNFREQLMDVIPHSRVFYEMQVEYRKWKRGTSSIPDLKQISKEWEKTIASTL